MPNLSTSIPQKYAALAALNTDIIPSARGFNIAISATVVVQGDDDVSANRYCVAGGDYIGIIKKIVSISNSGTAADITLLY